MKYLYIISFFICGVVFAIPTQNQEEGQAVKNIPLKRSYQVIIIGGGPAGLSCGERCADFGFSTLVIDAPSETPIQHSFIVQNWPGMSGLSWEEILKKQREALEKSSGTIVYRKALSITRSGGMFVVRTDKETFEGNVCVIATGKKSIPPVCQISASEPPRIFFRIYTFDMFRSVDTVSVVGDDLQTIKTALNLAPRVSKIYLFTTNMLIHVPLDILQTLKNYPNVQFIQPERLIRASNQKGRCLLEYGLRNSKYVQESSYIVFANLYPPQSAIASHLLPIDSQGAIITHDDAGSTDSPGLFACGEVASNEFLLGITSASYGMSTGMNVCRYLQEKGEKVTVRREEEAPSPEKSMEKGGQETEKGEALKKVQTPSS